MADYTGKKCIVCGGVFSENDDIVVCPECGTPYVSGGQTDTVTRTKQDKRFSVGLPEDSEITGKYLNVSA